MISFLSSDSSISVSVSRLLIVGCFFAFKAGWGVALDIIVPLRYALLGSIRYSPSFGK